MTEQQRIAVVTGANKGIGIHCARQLAQQGCTVYVGSRDAGRGQEATDTLVSEGLDARLLVLDVTDAATIAAAAAKVEQECGRLDILVNNAGINTGFEGPSELTMERLRRTFETNVFGVFATTNAFLPLLHKSDAARVVNVSSGAGSISRMASRVLEGPGVNAAAYRASKAALNMLTLAYVQELASTGIKFNIINPGMRATDLPGVGVFIPGSLDPAGGAEIVVKMSLLDEDGPNGGFFDDDGSVYAW